MSEWPLYRPPGRDVALTAFLPPEAAPQAQQQQRSDARQPDLVKQEVESVNQYQLSGSDGAGAPLPSLLQQQRARFLPAFADVLRTATPTRDEKPHVHEPQQFRQVLGATLPLETQQSSSTGKSSLDFILDDEQQRYDVPAASIDRYRSPEPATATYTTPGSAAYYHFPPTSQTVSMSGGAVLPSLASQGLHVSPNAATTTPAEATAAVTTPKRGTNAVAGRPASRTCKFAGCTHYVVDHGLCVRHGGGKRCTTEGCTSRAKHFGRCWRHGGSMECKTPGCVNRAKSRGYCWSHGGGTKCKTRSCSKIAISNGLCWAHGGGKRCIVAGCQKQAYERTRNYCNSHFQRLKQTGLMTDET